MTELTQALIGAAQAASLVANQAAQVSAIHTTSSSGAEPGVLKKDLAKLIPRPPVFNPADREQEVLQWRDWLWSLKQYLVVVDEAYQDEIEKMESSPHTEFDWDLLSDGEQQRSRFLYSLLGGLAQGRLVGVIKNIDKFNGYEALRQLLENCQPQARNRTMNLLFTQYERLGGGKLATDMKSAILLRSGEKM